MECLDWNEKSKIRKLLNDEQYKYIFNELKDLIPMINTHIK
jgi:hypothetical protein